MLNSHINHLNRFHPLGCIQSGSQTEHPFTPAKLIEPFLGILSDGDILDPR